MEVSKQALCKSQLVRQHCRRHVENAASLTAGRRLAVARKPGVVSLDNLRRDSAFVEEYQAIMRMLCKLLQRKLSTRATVCADTSPTTFRIHAANA